MAFHFSDSKVILKQWCAVMCNVAAEKKSLKEIGKLLKLDHQDPNELFLKSWLWRPRQFGPLMVEYLHPNESATALAATLSSCF